MPLNVISRFPNKTAHLWAAPNEVSNRCCLNKIHIVVEILDNCRLCIFTIELQKKCTELFHDGDPYHVETNP